MNLPEILPYFDNWKRSGSGRYMGSCPMPDHNDSDPSVSICQDSVTGNILIYCWGCNRRGRDLVSALGLTVRDLFGDPGHPEATVVSGVGGITQEITDEDIHILQEYLAQTYENLPLAKDYLFVRFGLSELSGQMMNLGVDPGDSSINRPEGYHQFSNGASHLIIPFLNPEGHPVGMQGRRLEAGEPRWRSVRGGGWSKIGCFRWDIQGPVVITEGPSDALAVVGRDHGPALAVRGASLSAHTQTIVQIKNWLKDRKAVVIGDNGEAGQRFAAEISEQVGIPQWKLPDGVGDLAEFLGNGGELSEARSLAAASSIISTPENHLVETLEEKEIRLTVIKDKILNSSLATAYINDELKQELKELPEEEREYVFSTIVREARRGDVGDTRDGVDQLRRSVQRIITNDPPNGNGGAGNHGGGGRPNPNGLPEILWNPEDQLNVTESNVQSAMDHYAGRQFYQAAPGQYVKVIGDDLVNLKEAGVKSMLGQMGHWRVIQGQREIGHVPHEAAKMITDPSWECGVPTIKRRVEVPFMLANGDIISNPGFHDASGVFLLPRADDQIIVPEVPAIGQITGDDVRRAKQIFDDVVEGFVFKNESSRTNLIAMTLTSPLRELFMANPMVPLLVSTAPQSGSGKGTSVRVPLSTAGIGPQSLATTAYNSDENEFEKKLVGKLLKKSTYIFLDNIRCQVNSAVLEQMLTAANYDGRTLGYSEVNSLSTMVLWVSTLQSTGTFNRDLTRRCVPVELIKNYKGKWAHKNIEGYLADMRGELIWACFVAARKWAQDGSVVSNARLDGYGGWTEVIGGILENVLEYEGFLGNLGSFRQQQDEISMTIDGILERWLTLYGEQALPARFAVEEFDDPALHQMLGLHGNPSTRQVVNMMTRLLDSQGGYIINNTHMWMPVGTMETSPEGSKKHYQCVPLPQEDD